MNTGLFFALWSFLTIGLTWVFILWGKEPVRNNVCYFAKVAYIVFTYTVLVAGWTLLYFYE